METSNPISTDGHEKPVVGPNGTIGIASDAVIHADSGTQSSDNGPADPATSASPRKRGRPSGKPSTTGSSSGNTTAKPQTQSNIFVDKKTLGQQLCGIHALAAMMLKQPVIAITDPEGEALAKSLVDIADYYKLTASKGILLWVNFGAVAAMIYGPKVAPLLRSKPKEQRATPSLVPSNTLNFGDAAH